MERAALFFDIDGTILSEITGEIPGSTICAMKEARKNGHLLFVNTGRTLCCIPDNLDQIPFDGFLCGCGTYLTCHGKVEYEKHLSAGQRQEIADLAEQCGMDGMFEGTDDVYFRAHKSRFAEIEQLKAGANLRGLGVERTLEQAGCIFDKMYLCTDEQSDLKSFFSVIGVYMDIIDRSGGNFECIPKGCSKATAIDMTLKHLGMSREQSFVFGDSSNDLSMFEYAGHAIAMAVHNPVLDPYTEFVTKAVEEDGIWYAMKRYGIIH